MSRPTRLSPINHTSTRAIWLHLPLILLLTSLFWLPALPAHPQEAANTNTEGSKIPEDEWLGVYLGGKKVGYSHTHAEKSTYEGSPALIETVSGKTNIQLLGTKVEMTENTKVISDLKRRPLHAIYDIFSNGSKIKVTAKYDYKASKIYCAIGEGESVTEKEIKIPSGANLSGSALSFSDDRELTVGARFQYTYLEPLTVELQTTKVEIKALQRIQTDNKTALDVYLAELDTPNGKVKMWIDKEGGFQRGEISLGVISMVMIKEAKDRALDAKYVSPALNLANTPAPIAIPEDFALATAIQPGSDIKTPRRLKVFRAEISGVPERNILPSDKRQKMQRVEGKPDTVEVTVEVESMDASSAQLLPIKNPEYNVYLGKAAYLETDNEELQQLVKVIVGSEKNALLAAKKIRNWVNLNMTPDAGIGVPRTALDVLKRKRGVCRDYATLFTALARAAGIPTRLASGIVFMQGKFFYHAWAECWVGQWIALDPTIMEPGQPDYVDATHVKFAQGDVTQMFTVVSIVGKIKVEPLETKYDEKEPLQ